LVATRGDGVIIEDRNEGRTRFVSSRQGQITPLATVAIYTYTNEGEGTVPLVDVFEKMFDQHETLPPASVNASSGELRDYFSAILPDHDRDRVHINDIKKCIKWYGFMYEKGILAAAKAEAATSETAAVPEAEEVTEQPAPEAKPKAAKKSAKAKS
ncbi:MAG: hypothetical protein ACKOCH_25940, partial [Bacteroidota bacterium]